MKKNILLILLLLTILLLGKEVNAAEEDYYNLIDMNQVAYNSNTNVFYSNQKISLKQNIDYTFVASSNFFGSVTKDNMSALSDHSVGADFTNLSNQPLSLSLNLSVASTGLYYSTITPNEDCTLEITDFLTKGYQIDSLPKQEVVLFAGSKEEFKGFRKVEYLNDYHKVGTTINIYTDCENPIKVEDITNKIKTYDNEQGFYGTPFLVTDNYNNTSEIGVYDLIYKAVDNNSNENILTVKVNVLDKLAPAIIGPNIIEWDCYDSFPQPIQILSYYTVFDNVDGDLTSELKTTNSLLFTYKQGVTKDYEVGLTVSDKAGNVSTKTIIVRAKDVTPPSLTVQDIDVTLSELGQIAFSDICEKIILEASDNSGEYFTSIEYKEVTGQMGFAGVYEVVAVVTDAAGNEVRKTANIKVIDDIAPEFYLQTDLFKTTTENPYSLEQIKEVISENLYNDGILYDSIELISCDYITNEKNPGTYSVKYAYSYKGETNYVIGTITVEEAVPRANNYLWLLLLIPIIIFAVAIFIIKRRRYSY